MIVSNSFDLWQKDAFFSIAEEVQESADVLESAYRTWVRERREGLAGENYTKLCSELQTALGTAKWQLEEMDRAVRLSHRNCSEDSTATRHREFVVAIENQISHIETALREFLNEDGKEPLHWVDLNKEERDDLAIFLSGTSRTLSSSKPGYIDSGLTTNHSVWEKNNCGKEDEDLNLNNSHSRDCKVEITSFEDAIYINKDIGSDATALEEKEDPEMRDGMNCQADRRSSSRRMNALANFSVLKILVPNTPALHVFDSPKEKGSKPALWKWKQSCGWNFHVRAMPSYIQLIRITRITQLFNCMGMFQRQLWRPHHLQFDCPVQLKLVVLLTIFLMVPFVLYST